MNMIKDDHTLKNEVGAFFGFDRPLVATFFQLVKYTRAICNNVSICFDDEGLSLSLETGNKVFYVYKNEFYYHIHFVHLEDSFRFDSTGAFLDKAKEECKSAITYIQDHTKDEIPVEGIIVDKGDIETEEEAEKIIVEVATEEESDPALQLSYSIKRDNSLLKSINDTLIPHFKQHRFVYAVCAFIVVAAIYLTIDAIINSRNIYFTQEIENLEYGKKYTVEELIDVDKEDASLSIVKYGNEYIANGLGDNELTFIAKKGDIKASATYTYSVKDQTPPIINCDDELSIEQFESREIIREKCKVTDACDKDISKNKIVLAGQVDTTTIGSYDATIRAIDAAGNTSTKDIIVKVVKRSDGTIDARDAAGHIGEKRSVIGKVVSWSFRDDVYGQPTFINLSDGYPAYKGLQIVVWGEYRSAEIISFCNDLNMGTYVMVNGVIKDYNGIPEIIVYSLKQMKTIDIN